MGKLWPWPPAVWADGTLNSFSSESRPQEGQTGFSSWRTSSSNWSSQGSQRYSYNGMGHSGIGRPQTLGEHRVGHSIRPGQGRKRTDCQRPPGDRKDWLQKVLRRVTREESGGRAGDPAGFCLTDVTVSLPLHRPH